MSNIRFVEKPATTKSQQNQIEAFSRKTDVWTFEIDGNNSRGDVLFWAYREKWGWVQGRIGKRGRVYWRVSDRLPQ
jgi:hypothetical protein